MSLLLNTSFEDNVTPEQVTADVRRLLMRRERKTQTRSTLFLILLLSFPIWFLWLFGPDSIVHSAMFKAILFLQAAFGLFAVILIPYDTIGRIRLIQAGVVGKGVILDVERSSSYGQDRNTVKVTYRFLPAEFRDAPDADLFRKEVPRYEGKAKLAALWGSFAADLRPGHLVSVIYSPRKPKRNLIVSLKRSELRRAGIFA